jgi:hypothetical protein
MMREAKFLPYIELHCERFDICAWR